MTEATAYPLSWPPNFPRVARREKGAFRTSLAGAMKNVADSLNAFARDSSKKIEGLVISSNVTLGSARPTDPGVAIWFGWDGLQVCIAVDRYDSIEANLQAIHHIIEARRTELRHGTLALVRATFAGFKALPAPTRTTPWRDALDLREDRPSRTTLDRVHRELRSLHHPDKGGDPDNFNAINQAYADAKQELGYV